MDDFSPAKPTGRRNEELFTRALFDTCFSNGVDENGQDIRKKRAGLLYFARMLGLFRGRGAVIVPIIVAVAVPVAANVHIVQRDT